MQAQAVVAVESGRVEFQDVQVPEPTSEDVVVRVEHSWISSGTEGSFVRGERIAGDTPRRETDPSPFPHVPGYQKVGIVEWVGADVPDLRVGDRVFASISHVEGMFYPFAGHVSPAVTHFSQVWKLPGSVCALAASGLVLTQVGYNAGMRPQVQAGEAAVVIGDGLVGHWTAQTLRHRGVRILLAGRHDDRLQLFTTSEQDVLLNTRCQSPCETVRAWAPDGVQVIVDTVGSVGAMEELYDVAKRGAHLVSVGFYGESGGIDIQKMRERELTLHAPSGWTRERMDATLQLLAEGALQSEHLITHHFPARHAAQAFELILSRRESFLGVVLDWE